MSKKKGKQKGVKWKVVLSILFLIIFIACQSIFGMLRQSFQASIAPNQVNDSIIEYSLINVLITSEIVPLSIVALFLFVYGVMWYSNIKILITNLLKRKEN